MAERMMELEASSVLRTALFPSSPLSRTSVNAKKCCPYELHLATVYRHSIGQHI